MSSTDKYSFRQSAALICLLVIGGFLLYSLRSFLTAFLSALILYVLLKPAMKFLCERLKWNKNLSVVSLLVLSFITILLPLSGLSLMLSSKVNYVLNHSDELLIQINTLEQLIREKAGVEIFSDSTMIRIKEFTANLIPGFLSKTLDMIGTIGLLYFILFFLLSQYGIVETQMQEMLPFSEENDKLFLAELQGMVFSSVLGAPVLAVIQGIVAGMGFLIFGLPEPLFWGVMCGFFSFLPVVGTALVWIPAAAFKYATGMHWQGIAILVFGGLIITNIDNVFRFVLQKKIANVHPVVTVLGVIMGINLLGLPGIVFGPLFISWFILLVKIYKNEYSDKPKIIITPASQEINSGKNEIINPDNKPG